MSGMAHKVQRGAAGYRKQHSGNGTTPLSTNAKILFLHHSTGENVWGGGTISGNPGSCRYWLNQYNSAHGTNYQVTETWFPGDPSGVPYPSDNFPYDFWNVWCNPNKDAAAQTQTTLETFVSQYDMIIFKHCFITSYIQPDTGTPDVTSPSRTLENYKAQYAVLKAKLDSFPGTRFLVWTGAAGVSSAALEERQRARAWCDYVKNTWDQADDNIFIFDFFELESGGGNCLLPEYDTGDGHPNATCSAMAAPKFCQRLIDVAQGLGDSRPLTGT